jgi:transposase
MRYPTRAYQSDQSSRVAASTAVLAPHERKAARREETERQLICSAHVANLTGCVHIRTTMHSGLYLVGGSSRLRLLMRARFQSTVWAARLTGAFDAAGMPGSFDSGLATACKRQRAGIKASDHVAGAVSRGAAGAARRARSPGCRVRHVVSPTQNRLESLLEEAHIKVSTLVSDLLGASARRMLRAIATGETDPAVVAALGSPRLHATPEQLCDALGAAVDVPPLYRRLLAMTLAELDLLESHMQQLDEELAALLRVHQDAVQRLAAVPGLGVDSAQQIIAEVGPTATTFPTAKHLASWVGACPGHDESAGVNHSHRVPSGNRQMRRLLNQSADAAVKTKGSIFEVLYRRFVGRLGHAQAIGVMRIGSVGWCGRSCTTASRTRNAARSSAKRGQSVEPPRCCANFVPSATASNSSRRRQGTHCDCRDFRPCLEDV